MKSSHRRGMCGATAMFTFGRDHEKDCAARHVRDPAQVATILSLIDSVHDLLEGRASEESVRSALEVAFVEGGSVVWEQAGSWLEKLCADDAGFHDLWLAFGSHPMAAVVVHYTLPGQEDFDSDDRPRSPDARRGDAFVWLGIDTTCGRCGWSTWLWTECEMLSWRGDGGTGGPALWDPVR